MFGIEKLADVPTELSKTYAGRLQMGKLHPAHATLRGPVGLFLVREDGANGSKLAKEVVGKRRSRGALWSIIAPPFIPIQCSVDEIDCTMIWIRISVTVDSSH